MTRTADNNFSRVGKDSIVRDPSSQNALTWWEIAYSSGLSITEKLDQVANSVISSWTWDMLKLVYDSNNDGVVNNSDQLWGQTLAHVMARSSHTWTQSTDTLTDWTNSKVYTVWEQNKLSWIETWAQVLSETNLTNRINALWAKSTNAVNGDSVVFVDSTDSNKVKRFSFASMASTLATLFGYRSGLHADSLLMADHGGSETYLSNPWTADSFLVSGALSTPNLWKTPTQARTAMLPTQSANTVLRSNWTDVSFWKVDTTTDLVNATPIVNGWTWVASVTPYSVVSTGSTSTSPIVSVPVGWLWTVLRSTWTSSTPSFSNSVIYKNLSTVTKNTAGSINAYSFTIPWGTLWTDWVVSGRIQLTNLQYYLTDYTETITININGTDVHSNVWFNNDNSWGTWGYFDFLIIGNGSTSSQKIYSTFNIGKAWVVTSISTANSATSIASWSNMSVVIKFSNAAAWSFAFTSDLILVKVL